MDGTKVKTYFEGLIKFHRNSAQVRGKLDDTGTVRTLVSRLLLVLQNQDKLNRDGILRQPNYAHSLVLTLQTVPDRAVHLAVAQCISELLGHSNTGRRAQVFVKHGATLALCQSMAMEWREVAPNDSMLMLVHQILSKLALKDKRLPAKARQCQCLPITLGLLRQCSSAGASAASASSSPGGGGGGGRSLHVPLALLKACAASQRNAAYLGRNGAVQLLLRLTEQCGRRQLTLLRLALDTLTCLTRLRSNAARALSQGGLGMAMAQFQDWQRRDTRHRNVPIRRALLMLMRQLTALRPGRRALGQMGGPAALYQLCREALGNAELEPLTSAASLVLRQCAPRTRLPVPSTMSPHSVGVGCQQFLDDDDDDDDDDIDDDDDDDDVDSCGDDDIDDDGVYGEFQPGRPDLDGRSLGDLEAAYGHLLAAETPPTGSLPCLTPQPPTASAARLDQPMRSLRLSASAAASSSPMLLSVSAKPLTSRRSQKSATAMTADADAAAASSALLTERYVRLSSRVRSVVRFRMLGYPDLIGAGPPPHREALTERKAVCAQALVLEDVRRWIDPSDVLDRVVFDLDDLVARSRGSTAAATNRLINEDELQIDQQQQQQQQQPPHLTFESRFESGNLRRAIQARRREYDLVLSPDIGHRGHLQWFYFRVGNCEAGGAPHRFNIVNCEKPSSQFNCGMRPLMFSVREALLGRPYWLRVGKDVCYYRNQYWRPRSAGSNGGPRLPYYTASFTVTFKHTGDICYLAYYVPYTYTRLLADLEEWGAAAEATAEGDTGGLVYSQQCLPGASLGGNQLPVLTITGEPLERGRPVVLVTGRVHPGESNASWTVRGLVNYLLSPAASLP